ncbi:MAG: family 78 glycoside hydrolase catalytic domain [Clostridiaceae bacterium]|nr:family 78 glycoside hydrolase catalytic domain [Clostridiaceae bacterium]
MIRIVQLRMNYQSELMAVEEMPQFSWIFGCDAHNVIQNSYQLQLSEDPEFADIIFDSGIVKSADSANIVPYGVELKTAHRYYARVKASANVGETDFCKPISFLTGLLEKNEWQAKFISIDQDKDSSNAHYIRKGFTADKPVKQALIFASALGLYKLYINGRRAGYAELAPGWTSYKNHLLYQSYDVTDLIKQGKNAIGAIVGAGWYKGKMGFVGLRNLYGDKTALLAQLLIRYQDGTEEIIASDESWKGSDSPIVFSEIYDGESYDASLEQEGWDQTGFNDADWQSTTTVCFDYSVLTAQRASAVREMETLQVQELMTTPQGDLVLDFGQNLSGWIHFRATGKKGDRVELNCFETLDSEGNVYLDNLRGAKQTIGYIFGRDGEVEFNPSFTFMGFRYAKIAAWPGQPKPEDFEVRALYSEMEQTGNFESSHEELNRLNKNVNWSLKSNFVDVPTDCPQRNERLGWTGDAQIFARTASYLMNSYEFFAKWLVDVAADQTADGGVPHVVPDIVSGHSDDDWLLGQGSHSAAAWADVAVIMPWAMYLNYGDKEIIRKQYHSMKNWISFMENNSVDYIWNYKLQFGDWVALDAEEGSYFGATPNDLTCTAYFAYSTRLFVKMAEIIGREDDVAKYEELYKKVLDKFQRTFFNEDGSLTAQTQTAHIVSLYFGLVPEQFRQKTVEGLIRLLDAENGHLVTGFVGTPYFCHALSENGKIDEAFKLLLRDDFPSWLYQVKKGATTIWEHWDGIKPDGSMWSPDMNSFNHYAYGAVAEWIYRVIGGLEVDEKAPGFKHSIIQPHIGGNLEYAKTSYMTPYGKIETHWRQENNEIKLQIRIPHNTRATILLNSVENVIDNGGLKFKSDGDGKFSATTGSGIWTILYSMK